MSLGSIAVAFSRGLLLAALLAGFAGCSVLSPAGALRVEVEVYKGPLSREPDVQFAELLALWREFNSAMDFYRQVVCAAFVGQVITTRESDRRRAERESLAGVPGCEAVAAGSGTKDASSPLLTTATGLSKFRAAAPSPINPGLQRKCVEYYGDQSSVMQKSEGSSCFYLAQVHIDTQFLLNSLDGTADLEEKAEKSARPLRASTGGDGKQADLPGEVRQFLLAVSSAAMQARTKAYFWAHSQVSFPVRERTTRGVVNNFSNLASEFGNQLSARADALLKQFSGTDARYQHPDYLPQNIYLRDSQPTDFLNIYVWNRAAAPAIWEDMLLHPLDSFSSDETATRVRTFERLYADNYWSRINTVSAVGTGEFRIALVKDDIGNWNLKSFDSDPSELLQAYKNAALAIMQKAVALAQEAANPAGGVTGLLGVANQLALGGAPASPNAASPESTAQITVLRRQAMERMRAAYKNAKARTDAGEDAQQALTSATTEWKSILGEHARIVSALSEAALSKGSDPAATAPLKPGAERMPVPKVLGP